MKAKQKNIPIPKSSRKRALIIVDIQDGFIKKWKGPFLQNLETLFRQESYDIYVEATFHAEKGSLWDKQTDWTFPYEPSIMLVQDFLREKKNVVSLIKETRSTWKGDKDITKIFKQKGIQEVHIVGFDTNDCVFATAQESFDLGFYTYVIEECVGASAGKKMHDYAIAILRDLGLTNHASKI